MKSIIKNTIFLKLNWLALAFLFLVIYPTKLQSQSKDTISLTIKKLPASLDTLWSFNLTDNFEFSKTDYDASKWKKHYNNLDYELIDSIGFKGFCWFRLKIKLPKQSRKIIYALELEHAGASEIYVDGNKITGFGKVGLSSLDEQRFNPNKVTQPIFLNDEEIHTIAIRYSNHNFEQFSNWDEDNVGFKCNIVEFKDQSFSDVTSQLAIGTFFLIVAGIFLALAMIHLLFFAYYKKQKQHLYYGTFTFFFSLFFIGFYIGKYTFSPDISIPLNYFTPIVIPFYFISLMGFVYYLVLEKLPKIFWVQVLIGVLIVVGFFFKTGINIVFHVALIIMVIVDSIKILYRGIKKGQKGVKIIAGGFSLFFGLIIVLILLFFYALANGNNMHIIVGGDLLVIVLVIISILSIPISISVYLARNFATLNIDLENKLIEVETMSAQMIEQEQEKKKILEEQNTVLEKQVKERTLELSQKNKDITDSINYAQRIQRSLLASNEMMANYFVDYFVFFQPKDIVSGDFYWAAQLENHQVALVTADSTGHGVPGAIMSMLNISCLSDAVEAQKLVQPSEILNHTRNKIIKQLANDGSAEGGKDGMDCSLVSFDFPNNRLTYAAANNPVWVARKGEAVLIELKPDKMPVGKHDNQNESFTLHSFDLQTGDVVYTLTDGLPDQFGGPNGKKFMYKQLKGLLLKNSSLPMNEQREELKTALNTWKEGYEQIDDICIIGVKIS